jgi:endonuclease/exonuclease/phosphatase family metal-dependent hydrolase
MMGSNMATFRVASLNCYNLFAVGVHRNRGPRTPQSLTSKINLLAATLKDASNGAVPDIVGLCEVGAEAIGKRLAETLSPGFYQTLWSGTTDPSQTGLMICYNPNVVQHTAIADDSTTRGAGQRCKWFAVELQLRIGSRARFWLVLNHWKSQMGGEAQTGISRSNSAREVGAFFLGTARRSSEAMLLIGDFNCEPGADSFKKPANQLRAIRERAIVLRDRNRLAYFYNPMWRLHGEADDYEATQKSGYKPPRPPGTYCPIDQSVGWLVLDQIMVSKRLLMGGPVRILESSLRIVKAHARCSDHCALVVQFEYV